jgi:tetratricopeptide (TPR) repeat protein
MSAGTGSTAHAYRDVLRLMQSKDWAGALARIDRELAADARDPLFLMYRAQCFMALGRRSDAFAAAQAAERCAAADPAIWDAAGTLYSYGSDQKRALAAYDRALALAPRNPQFLYNRATVRRFLGFLDEAEADYDRVIALKPTDFEAHKNRTDLRTQTAERNHIADLETLVSHPIADWRGEVQVRYALAKEYEDLGDYSKSFEHLRRGAKTRHDHLRYDIANDVATVQWIMDAFPRGSAPVSREPRGDAGLPGDADPPEGANPCDDAPIFVVGLPRSGTTLVERILGSHSLLYSAGELDCFALSLVEAVRRGTGRAQMPRRELVANSAAVDFAALGRDYLQRAYAASNGSLASNGSGRFIDKMPLNYLYCGLIRRALPNAKIVHVTRHPMAVCYAMYKTLFKDGYPFSYDLGEIASYYIAYRRLMAHWQATIPDGVYDLSYEALVADQLGETRKMLAYCGLDWEAACAQFHAHPAASTTASAVQIRRPIYDSSVFQWRHYEKQLAQLRIQLEAAGLKFE